MLLVDHNYELPRKAEITLTSAALFKRDRMKMALQLYRALEREKQETESKDFKCTHPPIVEA